MFGVDTAASDTKSLRLSDAFVVMLLGRGYGSGGDGRRRQYHIKAYELMSRL
jgi:hypothetical protein